MVSTTRRRYFALPFGWTSELAAVGGLVPLKRGDQLLCLLSPGGRHEADLRALRPSKPELIAAARWSMTQDPSPGYRMVLGEALNALGLMMMLSELRERARQAFLDFAWRQWAQAGVAGNIAFFDRWSTDPEALILFTIAVARRDPRLFDEVLDWMAANRHLLSLQRLRNAQPCTNLARLRASSCR